MDWLSQLLSVETPSGTVLHSASLSVRGLFPIWLAVAVGAVVALGVAFLYAREAGRIGGLRRAAMATLRVAALALLLFLLLRPVLVAEFRGERARAVAVLLDDSESMTQTDRRTTPADRRRSAIALDQVAPDAEIATLSEAGPSSSPSRVEIGRAAFANPRLKLLDGLGRQGPLAFFLAGQRLDEAGTTLPEWRADKPATALADAINGLLQRREGDLPAAVVVVTDGLDNASKQTLAEAAAEAGRLGVPLHIFGIGSSESAFLQLKDLAAPETLFAEDVAAVPLRWRARGFKQGKLEVSATLGGKPIALRDDQGREQAVLEVDPGEGDDLRRVLAFTPPKGREAEEQQELVVSVRIKGDDTYRDEIKRPVRIVDRRVKVLLIENTPRWEYKFLQATLLRDRRVEPTFLLVEGDPKVLKSGPPYLPAFPARDKLFAFDLIILGDVPASYLGSERIEWLREFVNEGGSLVLVAGRQHAPAEYAETALAEVLPVEFLPVKFPPDSDARPEPYAPVLTEAGRRDPMTALAESDEEGLKIWKELPGLYWRYPVTKLRPGAVALLEHPRAKAGDLPAPVLASHHYGKGRVLFQGTDETWRWRYNEGDRYFTRFWGQVVYQLGLPHLLGNARQAQLALDRPDATLGRPGAVYARLLDAEYRPLKAERVTARLDFLDAKPGEERSQSVTLEAVSGQPGEYRALLAHDRAGRFELVVPDPGPATLPYRVLLPPRHEMEPAGLAESALREAAALSGGQFYREEDLHRLAEQVKPRAAAFTLRQEVLLWNPLALLAFVGLVTAEWGLRKFSNLS